ncbi:unnamed protein product [Chrysodeixis includens]|uniref:Uncharacterized protein n=1 Tax=Chrysodeixis includens TaxID=689277 RepID=A0A9P0BTI8_CHRIL|nr:unnamed protein product [Chrysodeixis includens]
MHKNTQDMDKNKKIRTIQITYPAPYSQLWNAVNKSSPAIMKNNFRRRSNLKRPGEVQKAWCHCYSTVRGPDPTAPHLKYGVFPNRRSTSSRVLPKAPPLKPPPNRASHSFNTIPTRQMSDITGRTLKKKRERKEAPMFVFRTIDKAHTRQLSLSEMMHVDIKPKKPVVTSPPFCTTPTFKVLPPSVPPPSSGQTLAAAAKHRDDFQWRSVHWWGPI